MGGFRTVKISFSWQNNACQSNISIIFAVQ